MGIAIVIKWPDRYFSVEYIFKETSQYKWQRLFWVILYEVEEESEEVSPSARNFVSIDNRFGNTTYSGYIQ